MKEKTAVHRFESTTTFESALKYLRRFFWVYIILTIITVPVAGFFFTRGELQVAAGAIICYVAFIIGFELFKRFNARELVKAGEAKNIEIHSDHLMLNGTDPYNPEHSAYRTEMQVRVGFDKISGLEKYEGHKSDVQTKDGGGVRAMLYPFVNIAADRECWYSLEVKKGKGKGKTKTYILDIDDIGLFKKLVMKKK